MPTPFFQTISATLIEALALDHSTFLNNPKCGELFTQICADNNIIEYYLCEKTGSFIMIDNTGQVNYLIVKNHEDCRMYYELALDAGLSQQQLEDLHEGRLLPFAGNVDPVEMMEFNWQDNLYPATQFDAGQTYYYALVPNAKVAWIEAEKIQHYSRYLDLLEA